LIVAMPGRDSLYFSPVGYSKINDDTCGCRHQIKFSDILKIKDLQGKELWYSSKDDFSKWNCEWAKMEAKRESVAGRKKEMERRNRELDDLGRMTINKLDPEEE
jgi:hypothetical protein